jgi:hypothetical protein
LEHFAALKMGFLLRLRSKPSFSLQKTIISNFHNFLIFKDLHPLGGTGFEPVTSAV